MRTLALVFLSFAACATPRWLPATSPYVAATSGFEISLPAGWMRRNLTAGDRLLVTRDGYALQRVYVAASELGKPLGLGKGKRVMAAAFTPAEAAEVMIDDLSSEGVWNEVRVLENRPATIAGRPGFRIVAAFRDGDGLPTRVAAYGVAAGKRFYSLVYVAPERHYFAADLGAFDEMAASFRLREAVPSALGGPGVACPGVAGRTAHPASAATAGARSTRTISPRTGRCT